MADTTVGTSDEANATLRQLGYAFNNCKPGHSYRLNAYIICVSYYCSWRIA